MMARKPRLHSLVFAHPRNEANGEMSVRCDSCTGAAVALLGNSTVEALTFRLQEEPAVALPRAAVRGRYVFSGGSSVSSGSQGRGSGSARQCDVPP